MFDCTFCVINYTHKLESVLAFIEINFHPFHCLAFGTFSPVCLAMPWLSHSITESNLIQQIFIQFVQYQKTIKQMRMFAFSADDDSIIETSRRWEKKCGKFS
jgi:hypothetical protein